MKKLSLPHQARKLLPQLGLAIGGYVVLGLAAVAWYYFLHRWVDQDWSVFWLGFGASALAFVAATIAGVGLLNGLSIHRMYEQRIRRTWVISGIPRPGKLRQKAGQEDWQRVWVRPDLKVGQLAARPDENTSPYPIWVAALNIPGSTGAALLDRKSDGFVIAPLYSGSAITGWRKTADMPSYRNMRLSTAATISGAAASPNMGMTTHPTLAILMTLFNIRLGMWVTNPRVRRGLSGRAVALLHYVFGLYWNELVGRASHRGPWVYLSDGGHFENLGIYELLRRRCKYIVAVDATGEPPGKGPLNFGGLGIPLRMARIDFGVEVEMDLSGVERDGETGFAKSHFAVGRIRYPRSGGGHGQHDDPRDRDTGYLVLIKSALVADTVPPDIVHYVRQENAGFPYDSTVDQQFSQPQFESYRQLGFIAGNAVATAGGSGPVGSRFESIAQAYLRTLSSDGGPDRE